ncbi:UPF0547 protein C16orf87 homolog isoform X2 [Cimex lectularius]|uniref:Uncharacterized protein n=1 Tax=Cimex lectularius TaxID=79782 RepID=A0A8I6RQ72_CIMLE|nr:UPF0547 protein C16orf87 homolog isoform X2 [Cimex lectularius]
MGKNNKAITKCCPFCELQVAVACKSCPGCQHSFYNAKKLLAQSAVEDRGFGIRRRTERVKREKPNYYDASEFEKKTKKKRMERSSPELAREGGRDRSGVGIGTGRYSSGERDSKGNGTDDGRDGRGVSSNTDTLKKKTKKKPGKNVKESDEEDPFLNLSKEKLVQLSIVLAEINRKLHSTGWRAS